MVQTTTKPYSPFQKEQPPFSLESRADELDEIIPAMGIQEPVPLTSEKPIRVEEQYEVTERQALATTPTADFYDLVTTDAKEILLIADGADHFVDFNQQPTANSPKIFSGGSLAIPGKGISRIWAQTVTAANSTLRILVFKR